MKPKWKLIALLITMGLIWAGSAQAQVYPAGPPLPPPAFGMIGFIQEATVDGTVGGLAANPLPNTDPRAGGSLTVNGIKMWVPNNTFLQLPANSMTWQQLFDRRFSRAIGVYTPPRTNHLAGQSGLALADGAPRAHFPSFDVSVIGNIIPHPQSGTPQYVVGMIAPVAQQQLQDLAGVINYIDHDGSVLPGNIPGRFRVGGILGDPNTGALVEINDPVGRWGVIHSPDPRFTTDTNNATVCAENGFPVGIPTVAPRFLPGGGLDPNFVGDPDRPYTNRPLNGDARFPFDPWIATGAPLKTFTMPPPDSAGFLTDPRKALPLMVGDTVGIAGTLMKVDQGGPNTAANMFISAYAVAADLGVFTSPGSQPCYVFVEAILMPTAEIRNQPISIGGSPPAPIPSENSTRALVVGFTSDPTRLVDIYAIDVSPVDGSETERLIATVLAESITAVGGRIRGRLRFEPSRSTGIWPPTRDYVAKNRTGQVQLPDQAGGLPGLMSGQYRLPCFDFLFAERLGFGNPTVPNDFNAVPFLAQGGQPITNPNGTPAGLCGRLDPWPGP
jgi:hypothetical protein